MSAFNYVVKDAKGKQKKGVIQAGSARVARSQLRDQGLFPVRVEAAEEEAASKQLGSIQIELGNPLGGSKLALFTRQMATLIQSGVPLDEALATAAAQSEKATTKRLVLRVRARLVEGHSLASSLGVAPKSFNTLYRALVKAGESSGLLGEVLEQLADYLESRLDTQQKMVGALVYPIVLMVVAAVIVGFLMTSVVPDIVGVFVRNKQALPMLTEVVISISNFLVAYGAYLVIALGVGFFTLVKWLNTDAVQPRWHRFVLGLPVIGRLVQAIDSSRFAATLSILVRSGVNLVEALTIAAEVMTNQAMRSASQSVVDRVVGGTSLFKSMQDAAVFPLLLVHMVGSGERSGELAPMLEKAATHQERDLNTKLATFMALLEPVMILLMGGIVMLIVFAVLMPMFEMNNMVKI